MGLERFIKEFEDVKRDLVLIISDRDLLLPIYVNDSGDGVFYDSYGHLFWKNGSSGFDTPASSKHLFDAYKRFSDEDIDMEGVLVMTTNTLRKFYRKYSSEKNYISKGGLSVISSVN